MSKVEMPDPALSQVRFKGFACGWLPWMEWKWRELMGGEKQERHLVTTEQAEAYAAAKVREALEDAAKVCDAYFNEITEPRSNPYYDGALDAADILEQRIRALIPSTPA